MTADYIVDRFERLAIEDVYAEFGYGEARPEGLQEFLRYAYHEWREPRLRYVVLLGDATYDTKNYLGAPEVNQVPPIWEKTTWMWTESAPTWIFLFPTRFWMIFSKE